MMLWKSQTFVSVLVVLLGVFWTGYWTGHWTGQAFCQTPTAWIPPESLESLPSITDLPPLRISSNGRRVSSPSDWESRRREMKSMIQYFEYGHLPPRPDQVGVENVVKKPFGPDLGEEQQLTLVIGLREQLRMKIAIHCPDSDRRSPVIVTEVHRISELPCISLFLEHGYMFVQYQREDLDPDKAAVEGPAQQAYAEYDWATIAVWAWGAMRVVDYLETRPDVDLDRIAITGHSRGGKAALLAGALDERFTLVAPNGSGCGGGGCFRGTSPRAESLAQITDPKRFGYWFHPRLRWFAGREDRLPLDQHFVKALVAPRALLCTEARGDLWANPSGTRASSRAAQEVFEFLDVAEKNGLHFRDGQHDQTMADWQALLAFAQWQFYGQRPAEPARFSVQKARR